MSFLKKLFGQKDGSPTPAAPVSREQAIKTIQENTDKLWLYIDETLEYFNSISCQCAFPRYRQIVGLDCVDYAKNFYCSETEGFIGKSAPYFDIEKFDKGPEANNERWTCKKCGSTYWNGWSDFSIHVNRTFLKVEELKAVDVGAAIQTPLPLFVGIFGHSFPDKTQLVPVSFDIFSNYIRELKS